MKKKLTAEEIRRKMSEGAEKKVQESFDRRDSGFIRSSTLFKDGTPFPLWFPSEGDHAIDIISYLSGPNDPKNKEGEFAYVLDIEIHRNVGVNGEWYVCPAKNFRLPCPICEERKKIVRQAEDLENVDLTDYNTSRRSIYYIICRDDSEQEAKGLQIYQEAHFYMEKHLVARANKGRGRGRTSVGGIVPFPYNDRRGKTVLFSKKSIKGAMPEFYNHDFEDRDYEIDDTYIVQAYENPLDSFLYVPTYEELEESWKKGRGTEQKEEYEPGSIHPTNGGKREEQSTVFDRRSTPKDIEEASEPIQVIPGVCPIDGGIFGVSADEFEECADFDGKGNPCDNFEACLTQKATPAKEADPIPTRGGRRKQVIGPKQVNDDDIPF